MSGARGRMQLDDDVPDVFGSPFPRRADPRRDSLAVLSDRFSSARLDVSPLPSASLSALDIDPPLLHSHHHHTVATGAPITSAATSASAAGVPASSAHLARSLLVDVDDSAVPVARMRLSTNLHATTLSNVAALESLSQFHAEQSMRKRSFDVEDTTTVADSSHRLRRSNGTVSAAPSATTNDYEHDDDRRSAGAKVSRSVPDHALLLPADSPDLFARNDVTLARRANAAASRTPVAEFAVPGDFAFRGEWRNSMAPQSQPSSVPNSVPSSQSSSAGASVRSSALTTPRDTPSPLFRIDAADADSPPIASTGGTGLLRAVSSPVTTAKALFAAVASPSANIAPPRRTSRRRRFSKQLRGSSGFTSMIDLRSVSHSTAVADIRHAQLLHRDDVFEMDDSQPPSNDSSAASTRPQTPQGVPQSPLVPGDFDSDDDDDEPTAVFVPVAPRSSSIKKPHSAFGAMESDNIATIRNSNSNIATTIDTAATTTTTDIVTIATNTIATTTVTTTTTNDVAMLNASAVIEDEDPPESYVQLLPTVRSVHGDLPAIDEHTMHRVLSGELAHVVRNLIVIDCRFPYEFDGGHIRGATNVYREDMVVAHFFDGTTPRFSSDTTIVFHCEFSSRRGPEAMKLVRQHDRSLDKWPLLKYPEMYLLEGGYKRYYELSTVHLAPPAYIAMDDPRFAVERQHFMRDRDRRVQWRRNKSKSMNALVPNAQLSQSMMDLTRRLSRLDTE